MFLIWILSYRYSLRAWFLRYFYLPQSNSKSNSYLWVIIFVTEQVFILKKTLKNARIVYGTLRNGNLNLDGRRLFMTGFIFCSTETKIFATKKIFVEINGTRRSRYVSLPKTVYYILLFSYFIDASLLMGWTNIRVWVFLFVIALNKQFVRIEKCRKSSFPGASNLLLNYSLVHRPV